LASPAHATSASNAQRVTAASLRLFVSPVFFFCEESLE
jgi:hypothetical protein